MTWVMLARDSARVVFLVPTLASVAMIVLAEASQGPITIIRSRQVSTITASGSVPSLQCAARFIQSLTRLYRPGRAGMLGSALKESLQRLLAGSQGKIRHSVRRNKVNFSTLFTGTILKISRWLRRRVAPEEYGIRV